MYIKALCFLLNFFVYTVSMKKIAIVCLCGYVLFSFSACEMPDKSDPFTMQTLYGRWEKEEVNRWGETELYQINFSNKSSSVKKFSTYYKMTHPNGTTDVERGSGTWSVLEDRIYLSFTHPSEFTITCSAKYYWNPTPEELVINCDQAHWQFLDSGKYFKIRLP